MERASVRLGSDALWLMSLVPPSLIYCSGMYLIFSGYLLVSYLVTQDYPPYTTPGTPPTAYVNL